MADLQLKKSVSYRDLVYSYGIWWFIYTVLQSFVLYYSLDIQLAIAIKDALVTNTLLLIASYAMVNLIRFYQPRQVLRVIDSIGLAIVSMLIMRWLAPYVISEDATYLEFVEKSFIVRTFFGWIMISLFAASASLWFYIREQQEGEDRKMSSEKLAKEAELATLRQQLQPHFLFNSLNSISALAGSKPEEARRMIQQLSDFLRGTLKKDDQQLVTLTEELEHLQLYLEIEKVRFGHRLKTRIEKEDATLALKLPSLLLQPIVENAIKFGLYDTIGEITIVIDARTEDNYLHVKVENPFDPETSRPRQGTGFGLSSVQRRLYLLYARHDLLTTSQQDMLFITQVKIPQLQ
jgi:two-component system LytT family sensor kinase